jgi:hypothetical protein
MAFQLSGFQRNAFQIPNLQKVGGGGVSVVDGYSLRRNRLKRDDEVLLVIARAFIDKVLTQTQ